MSLKNRIDKLEQNSQPGPEKVYIPLRASKELGKPSFSNFTEKELEEVKQKYQDKYPDYELDFIVIRFVDDWKNVRQHDQKN